jgi:hypothetical protein
MVPAKITEFAIETHYSPLPKRVKIDIYDVTRVIKRLYSNHSEIDQNLATRPLQASQNAPRSAPTRLTCAA